MKHALTRRQLLQGTAALGLAVPGLATTRNSLFAAQEGAAQRSLVVVYLRGGADFLNMIVPRDERFYSLMRPGIGLVEDNAALQLDSDWMLHPSLGALKPLYDEKLLAPYVCTGSPHPTRSHFDAQDFMEFAAPGDRTVRSGWLNRYLEATAQGEVSGFRALAMQGLLPRSLRGTFPVLAVPPGFGGRGETNALDKFEDFYGSGDTMAPRDDEEADPVMQSGRVTIDTLRRFHEILGSAEDGNFGYPKSRFGQGLQRIAHVLLSGEGLEVAGIDINGWDTHANQGGATGTQARKLRDLGDGLAAFRKHLGARMKHTVVVVMTEFGRTVLENGSAGTDHGHGSGMLIFGGDVKGGEVHGEWKGLEPSQLYQSRDLPVHTDFRNVFGTLLREHFDFKAPRDFFPDYKSKRVHLFA